MPPRPQWSDLRHRLPRKGLRQSRYISRDQLAAQIGTWQRQVPKLLTAGQERGDIRRDRSAEDLADAVLALIQGGFVLTLSIRDKHTLTTVGTTVRELIEPPRR